MDILFVAPKNEKNPRTLPEKWCQFLARHARNALCYRHFLVVEDLILCGGKLWAIFSHMESWDGGQPGAGYRLSLVRCEVTVRKTPKPASKRSRNSDLRGWTAVVLQSGRNLREPPSGFPKKKCYIGDFQGSKGKPLSGLWKPRLISKKWAKLVEMTPRHRSLKLLTSDTSGECLHVPYRSLAGFQWGHWGKRPFFGCRSSFFLQVKNYWGIVCLKEVQESI